MTLDERKALLLAIITSIVIVIAIIAYGYHDHYNAVRSISGSPGSTFYLPLPPNPPPFTQNPNVGSREPITITLTVTTPEPEYVPASVRDEVVRVVMNSTVIKEILGDKEFSVSKVLPLASIEGELIGGCAIVNFPDLKLVWLEFNATDNRGKHLEYIGWIKQLVVCVDLRSKTVTGVTPILGTTEVPELPESISPRAKELVEKALDTVEKHLAKKYGLKEDEVTLKLIAIVNGIAGVKIYPKAKGKLDHEIIISVDVKMMKVIEELEYTPRTVHVVFVTTTITG